MNATSLMRVKKAVRNISYQRACEVLEEVIHLDHAAAVYKCLERVMRDHGLQQFLHGAVG